MLLRKLLFFPASFFCSSLVKDYSLATCFSPPPLSFSLSRARLYCCEPVFFFSMRFVPTRRRNRNMHVCTLTHLLSNYTIFFFHGSELNCFCIYSFLHALTFFFLRQGHTALQTCFFFFFVLFVPFSQLHWKFAYPFFRLLVSSSVSEKQHTSIYLSLSSPSQLRKEDKKKKETLSFFHLLFSFLLVAQGLPARRVF